MPGQQLRNRGLVRSLFRVSRSTGDQSQVIPTRLSVEVLLRFTLNKMAYCGVCIYLIVSLESRPAREGMDLWAGHCYLSAVGRCE